MPSRFDKSPNAVSHQDAKPQLYHERLVEHYEDPYHRGECPSPTHAAEVQSAGGDMVAFELTLISGKVREAWFDGEGDLPSQAVASLICEWIEGRSVEELTQVDAIGLAEELGVDATSEILPAVELGRSGILLALDTPTVDDEADAFFQGPHLGEEC